MSWVFEITTGRLYDPKGRVAGIGYAGALAGKNNPELESVANVGPLPEGKYVFGPLVQHHPEHGECCFRLIPASDNEMFGRSGFWCHGDTNPPGNASEGCLVMPRATREAMILSYDKLLRVVARISEGELVTT